MFLLSTPCSAWRLDDSPSLFFLLLELSATGYVLSLVCLSAVSRYARLCVVDARPTFAARAWASAAGWGGHRKYMNKQIVTYTRPNVSQNELLMNSLKTTLRTCFMKDPKEFLWTTLSDLKCPISADSSSINKEFFAISFFAKCLVVVRKI